MCASGKLWVPAGKLPDSKCAELLRHATSYALRAFRQLYSGLKMQSPITV